MGMKSKTIRGILSRKHEDWLKSIHDETVRELVKKNTIITGGCIASMLLGEEVNDYDVYFKDAETAKAVAQYYVDRFNERQESKHKDTGNIIKVFVEDKDDTAGDRRISVHVKSAGIVAEGESDGYQYFEGVTDDRVIGEYVEEVFERGTKAAEKDEDKYRPVFLSTNAITLSDKVQIVLRFYGTASELHENYDFVHCMNYWTSGNGELTLRPEALEALLARELRYVGSKYPICSMIRTRKFIQRGWKINAGQYLKMAMQINALDLNKIAVLQDQLTGVDVAYFHQLIDTLREKDTETVDSTYLMEVINRMF